tara:strand:- start:1172 stop:2401 length:1230 start_codon:yes stop_codon:yes gene_type:complete
MSIHVKKDAIRGLLRKALFEQVGGGWAAGDVDSAQGFHATDEEETTIPSEVPVEASDQMAMQLTQDRPPIEDEDFTPSSPTELGLAADAWGRLVPDDQVEYFYEKIKLIYDAALDRHNTPQEEEEDIEVSEEEEEVEKTNESFVRRPGLGRQASRVVEQLGLDDFFSAEEYDEYRGIDDAPEDDEVPQFSSSSGENLDDLASKFGYSGASGVRQDLERIFKRLGFTVENITDEKLDAVRTYAQSEFIDELLSQEFIDEEDAAELKKNPGEVSGLDSFRFFFVSGFMLPAYQKILRDARKRVEAEVDKIGLPKKTRQTVMNQALGDTPRRMDKLAAKLTRDAASEGMSPEEADAMLQKTIDLFPTLSKIGSAEGDLVATAMDIWSAAGNAKKKRVMSKALQSTAEFQDLE